MQLQLKPVDRSQLQQTAESVSDPFLLRTRGLLGSGGHGVGNGVSTATM